MPLSVRRVEYFYVMVRGAADEAGDLLNQLAAESVNLLALNLTPMGPESTQLTLFPDDSMRLQNAARAARLTLDGPHVAVLLQGEDEPGAIARVHHALHRAGVEVYASSAVVSGRGFYGYVIYTRPEHAERAIATLRE